MTIKNECIKYATNNPEGFVTKVMNIISPDTLRSIVDSASEAVLSQADAYDRCMADFKSWHCHRNWNFMWGMPIRVTKINDDRYMLTYSVAKIVYYKHNEDNGTYSFKDCSNGYDPIEYPYPGLNLLDKCVVLDMKIPEDRKCIIHLYR